jgi:hypothetical protein
MIDFFRKLFASKPKTEPKVEVYRTEMEEIKVPAPKPAAKAAAKRAKNTPSQAKKPAPAVKKTGKKTGKTA